MTVDDIKELAKRAGEEGESNTAIVLNILSGSSSELATLCQEFEKEDRLRIEANIILMKETK